MVGELAIVRSDAFTDAPGLEVGDELVRCLASLEKLTDAIGKS